MVLEDVGPAEGKPQKVALLVKRVAMEPQKALREQPEKTGRMRRPDEVKQADGRLREAEGKPLLNASPGLSQAEAGLLFSLLSQESPPGIGQQSEGSAGPVRERERRDHGSNEARRSPSSKRETET